LEKKTTLSGQLDEIFSLANDQEVASTLVNRRGAKPKIAITRMTGDGVVRFFTNYKTSGEEDPQERSDISISHTKQRISGPSTENG
jgi:hypothetical protein